MANRFFSMIGASLAAAVLLSSCAPATAPTPTAKATAAPSKVETSVAKPGAVLAAPSPSPKAAADQPKYGGILTGWVANDPEHLDIHQANSGWTLWPMGPAYNGLLQRAPAPPYNFAPDLAQSWEAAPDGKSYTFNLTPGVKWHDGKPFTAEDVKFSLDRMRDPPRGTISPRKTIYAAIDKVEVISPEKVKMSLQYPSPSIIEALAIGWSVMMPRHVIDALGNMKNTAVGTGAFKFREYMSGSQIALDKNRDFFVKTQPYLDGIRWFIIKDKAVQLAAFRTKRALVTGSGTRGLTPVELSIVKKEIPGVGVFAIPASGAGQTMTFNVTRPPFNDVKARRAVAMAIDQEEIINMALQGSAAVTGPMGTPGEWTLPGKELKALPGIRKPTASDAAEAKKLLAEAGYPDGLKTRYPFSAGSQFENVAQVVKEQVAKVGVDLTLQRLEAGLFQETQRQRDWDLMQTSHVSIINDPDALLMWYVTGSPNNFSGFSDRVVNDLYAKQSQTMDVGERKRLVNELERRLMEQIPILRLYESTHYFAHWPDVKGYQGVSISMNNTRWAHVWLAQ